MTTQCVYPVQWIAAILSVVLAFMVALDETQDETKRNLAISSLVIWAFSIIFLVGYCTNSKVFPL